MTTGGGIKVFASCSYKLHSMSHNYIYTHTHTHTVSPTMHVELTGNNITTILICLRDKFQEYGLMDRHVKSWLIHLFSS